MKPTLLVPLAFLLGCPDPQTDKIDGFDTAPVACDRIKGANGVVIFTDGGDSQNFPSTAPDATRTASVAGPLSDGATWAAVYGSRILLSPDEGCNWDDNGGALPASGDWKLIAAGNTTYAVDRNSSSFASSTDDAVSWAASDAGGTFLGLPRPDASAAGRLRGVQARGVVMSEDSGVNWSVTGTLPDGEAVGGDVFSGNGEIVVAAFTTGVSLSRTAGQTWEEIGTEPIADGFVPTGVAFAVDSADVIWLSGADADGPKILRTSNGGGDWGEAAGIRQIELEADAPLWPVPGNPNGLITSVGSATGDAYIQMHEIIAGDAIHTVQVGAYRHVNDLGFRADGAWITAVDAIE